MSGESENDVETCNTGSRWSASLPSDLGSHAIRGPMRKAVAPDKQKKSSHGGHGVFLVKHGFDPNSEIWNRPRRRRSSSVHWDSVTGRRPMSCN